VTIPPDPGHTLFAELTAGYALHALEPEDDQRFRAHLPDCPECQELVAGFTEVAAGLADVSSGDEPSPLLGKRIMAATRPAEPRVPVQHGLAARGATGHRARRVSPRRRRTLIASAAAAAVLIAGGATWAGLSGGSSAARPSVAGCTQSQACQMVTLTAARTHQSVGRVIVTGGTAWLVPSGLPADHRADQIYVLWQITGARTPVAVGSFDVAGRHSAAVRIGSLAVPYRGTWAFAVSLEHGREIPAVPSHPVALGQVPN
jgi:hypothetical protein